MAAYRSSAGERAPGKPRSDVAALTGLRAVAACWVVLLHLQTISGPFLEQLPLIRQLIGAGWTGVELFFVLSGFVITLSYADRLGHRPTPSGIGTFVFNRFARVWPAWAVITVLAGGWIWGVRTAGWDADVVSPHPAAGLHSLVRQLSMTHMWGYDKLGGSSFVPPGWSISAEWAAYLAFPLVIVLIRPIRRLPAGVLLLLAVAAMAPLSVHAFLYATPDYEQNWVLRILCGFTAGMLTALAFQRVRRSERSEAAALTAVWSSILLILAGVSWAAWAAWLQAQGGRSCDYYGVIVVVFPLLVLGLSLTERGPARWLAGRPMVYGGKVSYCLYLVHFVVIDITLTIWWQNQHVRGTVTPGLVLAVPGLIIISFLGAAALHHGVEEPARRLLLRALRELPDRAGALRRGRVLPVPTVGTGRHAKAWTSVTRPVPAVAPVASGRSSRQPRSGAADIPAPARSGSQAVLAGTVGPEA